MLVKERYCILGWVDNDEAKFAIGLTCWKTVLGACACLPEPEEEERIME